MPDPCSTCKWFVASTDPNIEDGTCHANPPQMLPQSGGGNRNGPPAPVWPAVLLTDFCGHHAPIVA